MYVIEVPARGKIMAEILPSLMQIINSQTQEDQLTPPRIRAKRTTPRQNTNCWEPEIMRKILKAVTPNPRAWGLHKTPCSAMSFPITLSQKSVPLWQHAWRFSWELGVETVSAAPWPCTKCLPNADIFVPWPATFPWLDQGCFFPIKLFTFKTFMFL